MDHVSIYLFRSHFSLVVKTPVCNYQPNETFFYPLFIMLSEIRLILSNEGYLPWCTLYVLCCAWIPSLTIQNESYQAVISWGAVYYAVQGGCNFKSVDETQVCDHSNGSYWAVLSCGTVYYAVQGGSNFQVCGWNPSVWPFKWKLLSINAVQGGSVKLSSLWMKLYRVTIQMKVLLSSTNCVLTLFNKSAIKNTVQKSPASVGVV